MDLFPDSDNHDGEGDDDRSSSSSSSSSPSSLAQLNINQSYASRFQHNKERAELHQLEEKYGKRAAEILLGKREREQDEEEEEDDESDSEDETEDEQGEQVTAEVDAAILRTLAKIRSGDASIYDSQSQVFDEEKALAAALSSSSSSLPKDTRNKIKNKKVTLADYQRHRLEDLIKESADPALALAEATTSRTREDDLAEGGYHSQQHLPLSHVEEQEQLRKQVTRAFHDADLGAAGAQDEEGADGDFFTKTEVAGDDDEDEEDEAGAYRRYLLQNIGDEKAQAAVREALRAQVDKAAEENGNLNLPAVTVGSSSSSSSKQVSKHTKSKKGKREADENEDFLMNYVLNRGWLENPQAAPKLGRRVKKEVKGQDDDDDEDTETPGETKNARTKAFSGSNAEDVYGRDWDAEAADLESEASFDSRAEAFEQAFNFRFEAMEAGQAASQIQSYSRNPLNSVRRVEEKRKIEREERRKRKEAEKKEKMEELDRMRSLKKASLRDKLKKLQEAAGSSRIDFDPFALEGDYDPEKHDAMMAAFGDEYYDEEDAGMAKPTWDDSDIDIADILAEGEEEEEAVEQGRKGNKRDKKEKRQKKKKGSQVSGASEDGPIDMDADFLDGAGGDEIIDESQLSKKELKKLRKKQKATSKSTKVGLEEEEDDISSAHPIPETEQERKAEAKRLAEEYRNLDYEDVVGDLPTRFRYTQVPKVDYGLTPVEILLADDKDLNDVVGLKHLLPYRKGAGKRPRDLNRKLGEFRRKLDAKNRFVDGRQLGGEEGEAQVTMKKRMGRKERQKAKAKAASASASASAITGDGYGAPKEASPDEPQGSNKKDFLADSSSTTTASKEQKFPADVEEEKIRRRKEKKKEKKKKRAAKVARIEGEETGRGGA